MILNLLILFLMLFILLLLSSLILPIFFYKKVDNDIKIDCSINHYNNVIKGEGFIIVNNILDEKCRKKLVNSFLKEARYNKNLNEDKNLEFYSNEKFLYQLSKLVGEKIYPVNSLDLQRCWIRYYFQGMKAQYYENYHHDIKRYNSTMKQYRLVIPIYDTSNSTFTINNSLEFPFKQNTGVFLEADNCLHKVNFDKGERLLLIMDFTTKNCDSLYNHYSCRGINGYYNWIKDVIWRNISSIYYKIVN
jgi:hypothetical protein